MKWSRLFTHITHYLNPVQCYKISISGLELNPQYLEQVAHENECVQKEVGYIRYSDVSDAYFFPSW